MMMSGQKWGCVGRVGGGSQSYHKGTAVNVFHIQSGGGGVSAVREMPPPPPPLPACQRSPDVQSLPSPRVPLFLISPRSPIIMGFTVLGGKGSVAWISRAML